MTKVTLHGFLAKAVGKAVWWLDVQTPREALRAIEANTNKLYSFLKTKDDGLALYQVLVNDKPTVALEDLAMPLRQFKTIDIAPVIAGSGNSGGLLAIIGAVLLLIAVSILTYGIATAPVGAGIAGSGAGVFGLGATASFWFTTTLTFGISLLLGGLSSLLAPTPDKKPGSSPSFSFDGAVNTTRQGVGIPILYGELIVGSATISSGLTAVDIPLNPNT